MHLRNISIQNFRCFQNTTAQGFKTINLLGGQNNVGKTAFLEALLLLNESNAQSIITLLKSRNVELDFMTRMPTIAWDNFFYQQQNSKEIVIKTDSFSRKWQLKIGILKQDEPELKNNSSFDEQKLISLTKELTIENSCDLIGGINKDGHTVGMYHLKTTTDDVIIVRNQSKGIINTNYIPSNKSASHEELALIFDTAKYEGWSDRLLAAFRLIDPSIVKVDSFSLGKTPSIYLQRNNEKYLPLSHFGDAMNKIANYVLRIVGSNNSVLLIDEIENGIHHSHQEELWSMLFKLALEFKVQIFATTHSGEMLNAFKNVTIKQQDSDNGAYFMLDRHHTTQEIIVQKIPIATLNERIQTQKPTRG
ncbi:MAG TPA: AAA family ATPase [Chitinophagales bacterium]|nr:AAA family ATPase [Chitinophagales bacterium]